MSHGRGIVCGGVERRLTLCKERPITSHMHNLHCFLSNILSMSNLFCGANAVCVATFLSTCSIMAISLSTTVLPTRRLVTLLNLIAKFQHPYSSAARKIGRLAFTEVGGQGIVVLLFHFRWSYSSCPSKEERYSIFGIQTSVLSSTLLCPTCKAGFIWKSESEGASRVIDRGAERECRTRDSVWRHMLRSSTCAVVQDLLMVPQFWGCTN
jgi:hypothetical protein